MGIKTISGQMAIPIEDEVKLGVDKSKSTTVSKISGNVGEQTEAQLAELKEELLSTVSKISSNVGEQTEAQLAEFKEELLSTVSKISSNVGKQTEAQLAELKEELLSTVSKISSNEGILNKLNALYERFNVFTIKQENHNSICSKEINEISNDIKRISENTEAATANVSEDICLSDNDLHSENEDSLLSATNIYIYVSAAISGALGALIANAIMF